MDPLELKHYVEDIREAEQRMGNKNIEPAASERINRDEFRLSLIASKDLFVGQKLGIQDFVISKPGTGLPPKYAEKIIGMELVRNILKGFPLLWEYLK